MCCGLKIDYFIFRPYHPTLANPHYFQNPFWFNSYKIAYIHWQLLEKCVKPAPTLPNVANLLLQIGHSTAAYLNIGGRKNWQHQTHMLAMFAQVGDSTSLQLHLFVQTFPTSLSRKKQFSKLVKAHTKLHKYVGNFHTICESCSQYLIFPKYVYNLKRYQEFATFLIKNKTKQCTV